MKFKILIVVTIVLFFTQIKSMEEEESRQKKLNAQRVELKKVRSEITRLQKREKELKTSILSLRGQSPAVLFETNFKLFASPSNDLEKAKNLVRENLNLIKSENLSDKVLEISMQAGNINLVNFILASFDYNKETLSSKLFGLINLKNWGNDGTNLFENSNKVAIIELLLTKGANPNIKIRNTSLLFSVINLGTKFTENALAIIKLLIKFGVDLNETQSEHGSPETALNNAESYHSAYDTAMKPIIDLLKENGAKKI